MTPRRRQGVRQSPREALEARERRRQSTQRRRQPRGSPQRGSPQRGQKVPRRSRRDGHAQVHGRHRRRRRRFPRRHKVTRELSFGPRGEGADCFYEVAKSTLSKQSGPRLDRMVGRREADSFLRAVHMNDLSYDVRLPKKPAMVLPFEHQSAHMIPMLPLVDQVYLGVGGKGESSAHASEPRAPDMAKATPRAQLFDTRSEAPAVMYDLPSPQPSTVGGARIDVNVGRGELFPHTAEGADAFYDAQKPAGHTPRVSMGRQSKRSDMFQLMRGQGADAIYDGADALSPRRRLVPDLAKQLPRVPNTVPMVDQVYEIEAPGSRRIPVPRFDKMSERNAQFKRRTEAPDRVYDPNFDAVKSRAPAFEFGPPVEWSYYSDDDQDDDRDQWRHPAPAPATATATAPSSRAAAPSSGPSGGLSGGLSSGLSRGRSGTHSGERSGGLREETSGLTSAGAISHVDTAGSESGNTRSPHPPDHPQPANASPKRRRADA